MAGRGAARAALLWCGLWLWALGTLCGPGSAAPRGWAGGSRGTPQPCRAPQQWEGRRVLFQRSTGLRSRALLAYDGLQRRVRVLEERKALIPCRR